MVFLLAYAMVLWAIAVIWRRRWQSFAALTLGIPPIAGLTHMAVILSNQPDEPPHTWIYYFGAVYAALVLGVGLFIAVLPRKGPEEACPQCNYDVQGIAETCPECGVTLDEDAPPSGGWRRRTSHPTATAPGFDADAAANTRADLLRAVRRAGVES